MTRFYLAFIVNGFIGLAIGYVWGCVDGYEVGRENGAQSAQNGLESPPAVRTMKDPASPENAAQDAHSGNNLTNENN